METGSEDTSDGPSVEPVREDPAAEDVVEKQVYLRTVYPLNPGIPHFIDVPGGW